MPDTPPFVITPRALSDLSAVQYRFATVRRAAHARDDLLIVTFTGSYGVGSAGNGDAAAMRAVIALGRRAFTPAGVVLDLRGLTYEWGDMMADVLNDAIVARVNPAVVVSDACRKAMTSLVASELGEDPAAWLFGTPDDALRAVDAGTSRTRPSSP
ncbi:hypothetical protein [Catenuloplanes indicus]|uniref:Uncharacterized protein n=1 Tax=Catenuloplanes indicus TaxID=137267 RepID=A0AAE3VW04_9ACTN|nr:hypothetical protein [Catenuloplanes indicus]MDQ0364015.1 hypothetical protein [Catenuloplanes indicus]